MPPLSINPPASMNSGTAMIGHESSAVNMRWRHQRERKTRLGHEDTQSAYSEGERHGHADDDQHEHRQHQENHETSRPRALCSVARIDSSNISPPPMGKIRYTNPMFSCMAGDVCASPIIRSRTPQITTTAE